MVALVAALGRVSMTVVAVSALRIVDRTVPQTVRLPVQVIAPELARIVAQILAGLSVPPIVPWETDR